VGWDVVSISPNISLCAHAIEQQNVFIIPDTLADEKFAKNPLVTTHPHIQFYAGVPLITSDNLVLGTLCVIDHQPRELNCKQIEALQTLSRSVVKLLELRRKATLVEPTNLKLHSGQKSKHFFTRMATGLGLASAILLGVGLVSYRSLTTLVHNNDWEIQHYQVLEDLKDLHSSIQKATIAKHRYIASRQASYLPPFYDAAKEMQSKIALLQQQTANNPYQKSRLTTLKLLIEGKFVKIQQIAVSIPNRDSHITSPNSLVRIPHSLLGVAIAPNQNRYNFSQTEQVGGASLVSQLQQDKKLTDEIEGILSEMERTEKALLQKRSQEEILRTRQSILTFSAGIGLNFFILAGVYYLTYREISDRKHTEAALSQERDFTDAILETVGALVVVLDPQGRIIRFNRACEQTTGYSFGEVKDKYFWELFPTPIDADTVKIHWEQLLASQSDNSYENYWLTREGFRRRIAWSNTTLRDRTPLFPPSRGDARGVAIAFGTDITENSRAEEALRSSEQHLRNIVNSLFTFVAVLTPEGILVQANQALLEAAALKPKDVLGKHLTQTYWWSYSPSIQVEMQTAIERVSQGERVRYEVDGRVSDNQFINIDFALTPMFDSAGKVNFLIASGIDVTERKQAEVARVQALDQLSSRVNELKQRNREITLLSEMNDFLQACLTVEEACTTLAQLVEPLFPGASGEIFLISNGKRLVEPVATWGVSPLSDLKSFIPSDCWALRRGKPHWVNDPDNGLLCKHLHHALPAESLCIPMMAQGEALGVLYLSSLETGTLTPAKQQLATTVAEHIALAMANLKLRETLQNQSVRDALTGLFNRRYMEESLKREMQRCDRKQQPLSIVMIDVDRFKRFNDTFGHNAGDAVLRELAQLLQKYVRGSDIACRYGGEEFTLILPEASLDVTQQRAELLRTAVKQLNVECNGQSVGVITLSMGVASFPTYGQDPEAVIKAADEALYRAKNEGRDRVIVAPYE
jgi:diguanylate cyclase (GGDEF)-like protein/PAS domain S-box-containing protein